MTIEYRVSRRVGDYRGTVAPLDQLDRSQGLVEFRQSSAVRIGIALHQAAALQDFDTQLVVGADRVGRNLEPLVPVSCLDGVTQRPAANAAKSTDDIERQEP